jgi:head-tail adaptor
MKVGGGMLRERLRFEQRVDADDGAGNVVGSWFAKFTIAARVKPMNWGESVIAARLAGTVNYEVTVRSSPETRQIDSTWRAVNIRKVLPNGKNETYNIKAPVNPDEQGAYLIFTSEAGVADG